MSVRDRSFAIFAEYGKGNVPMQKGANRRVYNTKLGVRGAITLQEDGSVRIPPGTWRIEGYSVVAPSSLEVVPSGPTFPGYCVVTETRYASDRTQTVANAIAVGSCAMGLYAGPSLFDAVRTFEEEVEICVVHQVGDNVDGMFLTYIDGDPSGPSPSRVFSKISIFEV